jgi:N-acetylglucosaminyl-diphospho-decaprenol L-rhamnosyltransferase
MAHTDLLSTARRRIAAFAQPHTGVLYCPLSNPMPPDLSIVVLSWNVADLLSACLRSLPAAASAWWDRTEVIVVDNASTDGSATLVHSDFPHARLILLPSNQGFSRGNNAGIRAARGKYILLLNPDTVSHPASIALLANYIEAHPKVGIVGPRLLNPDGTLQPSRRRFPTPLTSLVESTPLQKWFSDAPVLRDFYMLDKPDDQTQQVDWLSGAALMCRRETLSQVGLFDPGYFMFSEELDLCKRASDTGWAVVYVPAAEITHYGGQSTGQDVHARHLHFGASKVRYFRKHQGRIVGEIVRYYLLAVYLLQMLSEAAKWLLGHKRPLRAERLKMHAQVLKTGLKERLAQPPAQTRVLLITGEYPPARGGVGDYTCRLGAALRTTGIRARVLTRQREVEPPEPLIPQQSPDLHTLTQSIPLLVPKITFPSTLRALRNSRSRIAHIQYQTGAYDMRPTVNLLPLLLKRVWGGKAVVTFHDLLVPYLFPKAGPVRDWANRLLAKSADAVIATNPEDAARLRSWGVSEVELIPIGSNIPCNPPPDYDRVAWRASLGVGEDTILLANFGFLNSTKGLDDLLRALATLTQKGERPYRLMMVGGGIGSSDPTNRATAATIDALATELGVHDKLIWTGFLPPEEVSAALIASDMAILPYSDGASFRRGSLMAALEHAVPLITTQPPDNSKLKTQNSKLDWPELVDGQNAVLVPPGDPAALASAIERLATDPDLRARLSQASHELARFFSWDRIAGMHAALYSRLLKETQQPK